MTKISREEVLKLAAISQLEVKDSEIEAVAQQLEDVLSYAIRVTEIAADVQDVSIKNVNVFREDLIKPTDPELVRAQAPVREQDFFVVPAILDNEK
jgi:aspartyl-tRNA(Asn)/glutamyl-tRNA(Gln) amidotransferase subunit C